MSQETESQNSSKNLHPVVPISPLFLRAWARMYGLDPKEVETDAELRRACMHDWMMHLVLKSTEGGKR